MEFRKLVIFALVIAPLPGCGSSLERGSFDMGLSLPESTSSDDASQERDEAQQEKKGPRRLNQVAADIESHGERGTALILYEQAARTDGSAASWMRFGDACLRAGQMAKAIEAYRAAIDKEPANGQALMGLGVALVKQGEFDRALVFLQKAAPIVDTAEAYDRLGVASMLSGHPHEAIAALEQARQRAPADLDIAANLALASALAGQEQRALAIMREIVASPKANDRHRRNLVLVLGLAGQPDEARKAAPPGASKQEIEALLARANTVRGLRDPKARARAVGVQRLPPSA